MTPEDFERPLEAVVAARPAAQQDAVAAGDRGVSLADALDALNAD